MTTPLDILAAVRAGHTRLLPDLLKPLDRTGAGTCWPD